MSWNDFFRGRDDVAALKWQKRLQFARTYRVVVEPLVSMALADQGRYSEDAVDHVMARLWDEREKPHFGARVRKAVREATINPECYVPLVV